MITRLLTVFMFCFTAFAVSANNGPSGAVNLEDGKTQISLEIVDITAIEKIIEAEGLTYSELSEKYPHLVASANIESSANEEGLFEKSSDSPLGIPGFWWGFCLGWVGMLVVYLTMDEGSDRKEQVMNALWGCVISSIVGLLFYFVVLGAAIFGAN